MLYLSPLPPLPLHVRHGKLGTQYMPFLGVLATLLLSLIAKTSISPWKLKKKCISRATRSVEKKMSLYSESC